MENCSKRKREKKKPSKRKREKTADLYDQLRELRDSVANQTAFALDLSRRVALTEGASVKNFAFSPISVHAILSLIAAGSEGPVLNQVLSAVRSPSSDDLSRLSSRIVDLVLVDGSAWGGPRISSPNGVWIDSSSSLKPSFEGIVTSVYKAEAKTVNFKTKPEEARHEVNSWVENATAGLIKNLLPPGSIDRNTRVVLANALYFKGAWNQKFNASESQESEFHLLDGSSSVRVAFMTTKRIQDLSAFDGFKVLRLPYQTSRVQGECEVGRKFSMYVLLPDERDGLWGLWERLSSEPGFLDRYKPKPACAGRFKLPKFKIKSGLEASRVLKGMGMVLPFEGGAMTEMTSSPFGVSMIYHQAAVEVTEEGTKAAAATVAVRKQISCVPCLKVLPPVVDFEADHPFVYPIREDRSRAVMFVGHVLDPSKIE